jgi:phospholipase C
VARAEHLKDGGLDGVEFIKAIDGGNLPQVTFYKPQGNLNEHPGYRQFSRVTSISLTLLGICRRAHSGNTC